MQVPSPVVLWVVSPSLPFSLQLPFTLLADDPRHANTISRIPRPRPQAVPLVVASKK
jgi:hypothetical protein